MGLHAASPSTASPFEAFHDMHCLKLNKCVPQFCLYHGDIRFPSL